MSQTPHPFDSLTPDTVIDAVESTGRLSDLRIYPLNSYENRVYQVGIEDSDPIIAKFYRPQRWSDEQIREEHAFSWELFDAEIPVVPPLRDEAGNTLFHHGEFRVALYPRKGGHAPALDDLDSLLALGRLVGRIHAIGALRDFSARPAITVDDFAVASYELIVADFIPTELREAYQSLCQDLIAKLRAVFERCPYRNIRVHGDCHVGNILWRDDTAHFVDLDDCRMAPAIQDVWMFLSGNRHDQTAQIAELVEGYNEFYDFHPAQLQLVEALRTLRIMHYAAWLARRWEDPAFPHNFPWFNTVQYWSQHILMLREQLAALDEEPLPLM